MSEPKHHCSQNELSNREIVRGLLGISVVLIMGILGLIYLDKEVPSWLQMLAAGNMTGFFTYLRTTPEKTTPGGSAMQADNVENATFEAPAVVKKEEAQE
jgi:hypothetical protein